MPNWCNNRLVVNNGKGISPELKEFLKDGFSFNRIIPTNNDSCEENVEAWSTKWDLSDSEQKDCANNLIENSECYFDTAWSPPENVILKLSEMFSDTFQLYFMEGGMQFAGIIDYSDGCSHEQSVDFDKEEMIPFMVEHMGWHEEEAEEYFFN